MDQTGTVTYNADKVSSDYLKPLCKTKYTINDTLSFEIDKTFTTITRTSTTLLLICFIQRNVIIYKHTIGWDHRLHNRKYLHP